MSYKLISLAHSLQSNTRWLSPWQSRQWALHGICSFLQPFSPRRWHMCSVMTLIIHAICTHCYESNDRVLVTKSLTFNTVFIFETWQARLVWRLVKNKAGATHVCASFHSVIRQCSNRAQTLIIAFLRASYTALLPSPCYMWSQKYVRGLKNDHVACMQVKLHCPLLWKLKLLLLPAILKQRTSWVNWNSGEWVW